MWSLEDFLGFVGFRWFSLGFVGLRWVSLGFVGLRWCVGDFRLLFYSGDIDCSVFIVVATISSCCSNNKKNVRPLQDVVGFVGFR